MVTMLIPLTHRADFLGLGPTSSANVLVKLCSPTEPGPVLLNGARRPAEPRSAAKAGDERFKHGVKLLGNFNLHEMTGANDVADLGVGENRPNGGGVLGLGTDP